MGLGRSGQRRKEAAASPPPTSSSAPRPWGDVGGIVIPTPFDPTTLMKSARMRAQARVLAQPGAQPADFAEQMAAIEAHARRHVHRRRPRIARRSRRTRPADAVDLRQHPGAERGSRRRSGAAVRVELPHHPGHRTRRDRRLPRSVPAVRPAGQSPTWWSPPMSWSPATAPPRDTSRPVTAAGCIPSAADRARSPTRTPTSGEPLTDDQIGLVADRTATQFVGNPDEVADRLELLRRVTDADELVITSVTHRHADRLRSHELIAKRWGLTG